MTPHLQEAIAALQELPDTFQNAVADAILLTINQHSQAEEFGAA